MKKKINIGYLIFDIFNVIFLIALSIICLYPIWYCMVASVSDPSAIARAGGMMLLPEGFQTLAYKAVFSNEDILVGYANTLFYVGVGTVLNLILTMIAGYVLSRKRLLLSKQMNLYVTITMYVSGGMIPIYLVIRSLGLLDSRMVILLVGAVSTFNVMMARTYFYSSPDALEEAARVDGAGELRILFSVMLPLAKPIMAVLALYYAVGRWNEWFNAMIYLTDRSKFPLQLILREILLQGNVEGDGSGAADVAQIGENIKFATIVVATLPVLCVYPFVQKYFVKGVMVGAVKG